MAGPTASITKTTLRFDVKEFEKDTVNSGKLNGRDIYRFKVELFDKSNKPYVKTIYVAASSVKLAFEHVAAISKKTKSKAAFNEFYAGGKCHTLGLKEEGSGKDRIHSVSMLTDNFAKNRLVSSFPKGSSTSNIVKFNNSEIEEIEKMAKAWQGSALTGSKKTTKKKPILALRANKKTSKKKKLRKKKHNPSSSTRATTPGVITPKNRLGPAPVRSRRSQAMRDADFTFWNQGLSEGGARVT